MKFKKCMKCGALVEVINDCICDDCGITCCNSQMVELKPNSSDGAVEKHKPEYVVNGLEMKITVNNVMEENHYIMWIKVVNGEIVEKKDFIFQELVKPYKKKIPKNVEELTGITNKMVAECRNIWEVFPDFVKFIENNVLVGYNCMTFDSKFLVRAGRLSNLIINNQYFDVMHLVKKYKKSLDTENMTLVQVGKALGIENPQAHRALADAITTAKVYLKILELNRKEHLVKVNR